MPDPSLLDSSRTFADSLRSHERQIVKINRDLFFVMSRLILSKFECLSRSKRGGILNIIQLRAFERKSATLDLSSRFYLTQFDYNSVRGKVGQLES